MDLEKENLKRIEALQQNTPFCTTSDWQGAGCHRPSNNKLGVGNTEQNGQQGIGDEAQIPTPQPHLHAELEGQDTSREDTSATTSTTGNSTINPHPNRTQPLDEELVIPDVSHITPPKYEDVRMRKGGGPCKKTRKERVLRRKVQCGNREVVR